MVTRTTNQLHFEDLDPIRFEELVFSMVYRMKNWERLDHFGKKGSDDGIDIRAIEMMDNGSSNVYYFQCKRYQKIAISNIKKIVDDYLEKNNYIPQFYILVVSCNMTKRQIEFFENYCIKHGFNSVTIWTSSYIEAKLYTEYKDLLNIYFGLDLFCVDKSLNKEIREYKQIGIKEIDKDISNYHNNLFFKLLRILFALFILLLPYIIKYNYQESWKLPDFLKKQCQTIQSANMDKAYSIIFLIVVVIVYNYKKIDVEFINKRFSNENLDIDDFDLRPDEFVRKIIQFCGGKIIVENTENDILNYKEWIYIKRLKGMEILSRKGDCIDYFLLKNCNLNFRIFLVNASYTKHQAAKVLISQGFNYCEYEEKIMHFQKNDLHIRIAYKDYGHVIVGMEICRKNIESKLAYSIKEEMNDDFECYLKNLKHEILKILHDWMKKDENEMHKDWQDTDRSK